MSRHEDGILGDVDLRRRRQEAEAKIRRINSDDLNALDRNVSFRRWFGKWATILMTDLSTTNGGELQHFMGRRSLVLKQIEEFDVECPGFYQRVVAARKELDNELRPEPQSGE